MVYLLPPVEPTPAVQMEKSVELKKIFQFKNGDNFRHQVYGPVKKIDFNLVMRIINGRRQTIVVSPWDLVEELD